MQCCEVQSPTTITNIQLNNQYVNLQIHHSGEGGGTRDGGGKKGQGQKGGKSNNKGTRWRQSWWWE